MGKPELSRVNDVCQDVAGEESVPMTFSAFDELTDILTLTEIILEVGQRKGRQK